MLNAMSLFSGGGIGETYLNEIGIHTIIANEFVKERANIYKYRFPETNMIVGDIKEKKQELISLGKKENPKLLIATPPCQGMSILGKKDYDGDQRNYLIFDVFDIIDALDFDYIFIENVPQFLKMYYPNNKSGKILLTDLLQEKYCEKYNIVYGVYNAADYGVPQRRKRAIIRIFKKGLSWNEPQKNEKHITLREAIGHLPSIEAGEKSGIKWHNGPSISADKAEMLRHTPSGCSAFQNEIYFPKKKDGTRITGFNNTYTRLDWDSVCSTRTMTSGSISGSNNGHPGRCLVNGDEETRRYSDARTLSLLELFIVSSLPEDMDFPEKTSERLIRDIVGEGVPAKMSKAFLKMLV